MSIPYNIFLGVYLLVVLFILIFAAINLLHIVRLSRLSSQMMFVVVIFIAGLLFILSMSYQSLNKINWQTSANFANTIEGTIKEFNPL